MYLVDEKGNKKPINENFQQFNRPFKDVRENYGDDKKFPKWLYWVLIAVAVIVIILVVYWIFKPKSLANMAQQRFGFRFY